ncbi:hypothetical protein Salat_1140200 [Sesamum alatum]|uniref:Uncharacterized protein n=1 Tax=Sesamum alatum TaxID=300844 RepID=A0AAE2CN90_9LAMI|nr:hypothetical protein Salat_1140200 [Sesamum alatum]
MKEKGKEEFDPATEMEISSILESDLPPDEKSELLASYFPLQSKTFGSLSGITFEEKIEHTDEANAKEEHYSNEESELEESSLSHPSSQQEKSQHIGAIAKEEDNDESRARGEFFDPYLYTQNCIFGPEHPNIEEQAKVDPNLKLTSDEKSQSLVHDRTEGNVHLSKLNSSSTLSKIEFKEKDQLHVEMEAKDDHDNGSLKWMDEGSSFRSQKIHVEDCHVSLELKQEFVIARVEEPQSNYNGT